MKGSKPVILLRLIETSQKDFNDNVNKVLENPKYSYLKAETNSYIERIRKNIRDKLNEFFEDGFSEFSIDKGAVKAVIIALVLLIIAIIIFIVIRNIMKFERRSTIKNIFGEEIDENTTPVTLKDKALKAAEAGDFREAIRYDYIALLFLMHEKDLIYLEETKTNEEIYNYLRTKMFYLLDDMRICIDVFNLVWYGHKDGNKEMYDRWTNILSKLWNEVSLYEEKKK